MSANEKSIKALKRYSKSQASPAKKIAWFKKRHIELLADIKLLQSRLRLAHKKIIFLEEKYWNTHNVRPTYQDLSLRVAQIEGRRKIKKKQNDKK